MVFLVLLSLKANYRVTLYMYHVIIATSEPHIQYMTFIPMIVFLIWVYITQLQVGLHQYPEVFTKIHVAILQTGFVVFIIQETSLFLTQ